MNEQEQAPAPGPHEELFVVITISHCNRRCSMQDELKRADERVKTAEAKVVVIEDELAAIGENQKQLEVSEEKARKREEKYQVFYSKQCFRIS